MTIFQQFFRLIHIGFVGRYGLNCKRKYAGCTVGYGARCHQRDILSEIRSHGVDQRTILCTDGNDSESSAKTQNGLRTAWCGQYPAFFRNISIIMTIWKLRIQGQTGSVWIAVFFRDIRVARIVESKMSDSTDRMYSPLMPIEKLARSEQEEVVHCIPTKSQIKICERSYTSR